MATVDLTVPDLGGFSDIPVIEVLVNPGDTVKKDDPLVTLESDKATMEVPASAAGTIREIAVKVGDKVSQGSVLVRVDAAEQQNPTPPAPPPIPPNDAVGIVAADAGSAMETGAPPPPHLVPPPPASRAAAPASRAAAPAPRADAPAAAPAANGRAPSPPAPAAAASTNGTASAPVHASPAIRRFARELGVDLGRVSGTGPNGRVTRDDVQSFVKSALVAGPQSAPSRTGGGIALNLPPWPTVDFAKFGPIERVALSRIQKISGPALARNWVMIPHVTQNDDADVTELEAFRKAINAERKDVKVTMLAFLMKAAVAALKRFPQFNASLDGDELVLKKYYHLGFAADTPNGLVVPVIKDVDAKGIADIAAETSALAAKARDGKLGPNDMSGSTFTISSLGSIGGTYFTPIINAPEVAILGACKAEMRPVWDGASFVPRLVQPLSLSYDHRVIDGAAAARFTVAIKESLSDLRRVLL
jgi:pyruvate dehydrogenase E2 component (dihydrolipoamide acetyltransferase)